MSAYKTNHEIGNFNDSHGWEWLYVGLEFV